MKIMTAILTAATLVLGSVAYAEDHPMRVDEHHDASHGGHANVPDIHVNTDHSTVGAHVDNHGADTHAAAPHDQSGHDDHRDNRGPRDH